MYSVLAGYIMLMARIREVVHLYVVLDAFSYEAEAVFPNDYRVDGALADEKLALEILGLVDEAGLGITFRIGGRIVHVTLTVHYLVPLPVDYRTSGNSYLEHVRIVSDQ
jgi:hypothetical protein